MNAVKKSMSDALKSMASTLKSVPSAFKQSFSNFGRLPKINFSLATLSFLGLAVVAVLGSVLTIEIAKSLARFSFAKLPSLKQQAEGLSIFDRYDKLVCVVQKGENKEPIPIEKMSVNMRNAMIAAEDHNFYRHFGIDPFGIARATVSNVKAGRIVEGGSTITQQLAKVMFSDSEDRTLQRKAHEAVIAIDLESGYSKNKILETYLNLVYFGNGAYGIEKAAQTYFHKHAKDLTVAESAFLAGLVKSPSGLGAPTNKAKALVRQKQILNDMVECGFITANQAASAKSEKLALKYDWQPTKFPHYINHVIALLEKDLGKDELWKQPLNVYTYIDPKAQKQAEKDLERGVKAAPAGINQGALISISVPDGGVVAMVGGAGTYKKTQWNRALYPHTAGSAFKPFVYLAGIISGAIKPHTLIQDEPLQIAYDKYTYSPENYDGTFMGTLTVRDALALSRNVCAVWAISQIGVNPVITTAKQAGITTEIGPYPSIALGSCAVTPLDLANSYATLARSGVFRDPLFVRKVEYTSGTILKTYDNAPVVRLPAEPVNQIVDILQDVVTRGTGRNARLAGVQSAGKTGTADNCKDVWYVGFTPDVVTAVWAGNDANKTVNASGVTGGAIPAKIWKDYMTSYYQSHPKPLVAFAQPQEPFAHHDYVLSLIPPSIPQYVQEFTDGAQRIVREETTHAKRGFFGKLSGFVKSWF